MSAGDYTEDEARVVEIGSAEIPKGKDERRELLGEAANGLKGGKYTMFARIESGRIDPRLVTLVRQEGDNGYEVCDNVAIKKLATRPNTITLQQQHVTFNPTTEELSVSDAFVREASTQVRHLAEDTLVPGLSIISRIGEMAALLSEQGEVEGTYRGVNAGKAIVEQSDGSLIACDDDGSFRKYKDGDPLRVKRSEGDDLEVSRTELKGGTVVDHADGIENTMELTRHLGGLS